MVAGPERPSRQNESGQRKDQRPAPTRHGGARLRGRSFGSSFRDPFSNWLNEYRSRWNYGRRGGNVSGSDPAVAAPLHGFDENRVVGGVPECVAEPVDGAADAMVEVDEYAFRPQCLAELLAAQHLVGVAQQKLQRPEGQILNLDFGAILPQLAGALV